jgi:DNA polymerase-3 subunit delta'
MSQKKETTKESDFFWPLIGNRAVRDFLLKTLAVDQPAPAYVFTGISAVGKSTAARCFALNLLKSHNPAFADLGLDGLERSGDVTTLECLPDKQLIGIEQVRELIIRLELGSFSNSYKIGIIKGADKLSEGASNALLKMLEEPRPRTVMILTASSQESLLPTILSRSQVIEFQPVEKEELFGYLKKNSGVSQDLARQCASLALGRPGLALKLAVDPEYLAEYETIAFKVLDLFSVDSEIRFAAAEDLARHLENSSSRFDLEDALIIAASWLRDCLLAHWEAPQWRRHETWRAQLDSLSRQPDFNPEGIARRLRLVFQAQRYTRAYFNSKTVLEYLAINL